MSYLKALVISIASCLTAYFTLGIFMVIYLVIDTDFMNYLFQAAYPQLQLTPLSVFLLLMFEGLVGAVVMSFSALQFYVDRIRKVA